MNHPIIVIGTGLAGYQFSREFRKLDTTTPLKMITADEGYFYSKPQLSNAFAMQRTPEQLIHGSAETMSKQLNASILTKKHVTHIDPKNQVIYCQNEAHPFSKLIIACGAEVIHPPLQGTAHNQVLSVNHLTDYMHFCEHIKNKKRIVILGAGLISSEFSNDLSVAGFDVQVVAPAVAPLDLLIPISIGKLLQTALENIGVKFHLNCLANEVEQLPDQTIALHLSNHEKLIADCVISAIGLKPKIDLVKNTDIAVNRGIIVNRFLETNQLNIYALGDCAEVETYFLPYVAPLLNSARALAHTIAGNKTAVHYPAMPITVKTPAYPLIVCAPQKGCIGEWEMQQDGNNVCASFYDQNKQLRGFILTNQFITKRAELIKQIPALI